MNHEAWCKSSNCDPTACNQCDQCRIAYDTAKLHVEDKIKDLIIWYETHTDKWDRVVNRNQLLGNLRQLLS